MAGSTRRVSIIAEFRARVGAMTRPLNIVIGLTGKLLGMLTSIKGLLAGASLFAALREGAKLNIAYESTLVSMATNFEGASKGALNFSSAMGLATNNLNIMKQQAADLPGTFDEMSLSFNTMLPALSRFGPLLSEMRDLAALTVVASKTQGVEVWKIASDVAQLMTGNATDRMVQTFSLKPVVKEITALVRASKSTEALALITKTLSPSQQALDAYATTWDAAFSTAKDNAATLWRIASNPLFEAAKAQIVAINAYFVANKEELIATAKVWGKGIVTGIKTAWKFLAKELYPKLIEIRDVVIENANWFRVIAEVWVMGHLVKGLMAVIAKIKAAVVATGALKLAMMGLSGVVSLALAAGLAYVVKEMHDIRDSMKSVEDIGNRIRQRQSDTRAEFAKVSQTEEFKKWASTIVGPGGDPTSTLRHSQVRDLHGKAELMRAAGQPMLERTLREQAAALSSARGPAAAALARGDFAEQARLLRLFRAQQKAPTEDPGLTDYRFPKSGDGDKPAVNVKIDNVFLTMNIDEGDPDRIALALPRILMQPILAPAGS